MTTRNMYQACNITRKSSTDCITPPHYVISETIFPANHLARTSKHKGLANAKRSCDCSVLCPRLETSLCSCLHCILDMMSFGSADSVHRASMRRYRQKSVDVSVCRGGGSLSANISGGSGQFPATPVGVKRLEISLFHTVLRY